MVSQSILREIVRADLLAAIAAAHLLLAFLGKLGILPLHLLLVEPRPQNAHSLFAILDLRFLVLAAYDSVGWDVGNAHRGISSVYGLAAWARGAEGIDAEVLGFNLDVYIFSFRQDRNRDCRCMHAPLRFSGGDALHAVNAAFPLQLRVHALAFNNGNHFLITAHARFRQRHDFDFPPVLLGKARVHTE